MDGNGNSRQAIHGASLMKRDELPPPRAVLAVRLPDNHLLPARNYRKRTQMDPSRLTSVECCSI